MIIEIIVFDELSKGNCPGVVTDLIATSALETEQEVLREFGDNALGVTGPIISSIDRAVKRAISRFAAR